MAKPSESDIVESAVRDAKALRDAAVSAAKDQIVQELAPGITQLFESAVRSALDEKRGLTGRIGQSQRGDYMSPKLAKWEESKEARGEQDMADKSKKGGEEELDLEALGAFFPNMSEDPDPDPDPDIDPSAEHDMGHPHVQSGQLKIDPSAKPDEGVQMEEPEPDPDPDPAAAKCEGKDKKDKKDDDLDESVEISEEALKQMYDKCLQTEVQVKKGFSDMTKAGELEEVDPASGINDVKKGEAFWNEEEPPAAEKRIPEAAELALIVRRGLAENKQLRENLKKAVTTIKHLGARLHEVNLFNSKILHVNKILNSGARLSREEKRVAMESIDKAQSIPEVKMVYEAVTNSLKAAKAVNEARKPRADVQRRTTAGSPDPRVLRESVERNGNSERNARFAELAGLKDLVK